MLKSLFKVNFCCDRCDWRRKSLKFSTSWKSYSASKSDPDELKWWFVSLTESKSFMTPVASRSLTCIQNVRVKKFNEPICFRVQRQTGTVLHFYKENNYLHPTVMVLNIFHFFWWENSQRLSLINPRTNYHLFPQILPISNPQMKFMSFFYRILFDFSFCVFR